MNVAPLYRNDFNAGLAAAVAAVILLAAVLAVPDAHAQRLVDRGQTLPVATGWEQRTLFEGISHPWGIAWLPSGEMLVTSRDGRLYRYDQGSLTEVPMPGLPSLFVESQGGLFDIAVRPADGGSEGAVVYLTMATGTSQANRTILVRGHYDGRRVTGIETIFRVQPDKTGGEHFGGRLAWLADGTLLMSVGDGGNPPRRIGGMLARDQAQNLSTHLGSILRLDGDGKAARDNPFVQRAGAKPEIWAYGHRNIQGLTRDPRTQRVWATEHGPRGGDELNLVVAGQNSGWPRASYGRDYVTRRPIGQTSIAGAANPQAVWLPTSIAPSGLAIYAGAPFPAWRGDLFAGALVGEEVQRMVVDDAGNVTRIERLPIGDRVRDVRLGPDGLLYVLTDETAGKIIRIEPKP